jgi:malate dehydrogenase (oxaloacetate-decarboxylating)
MLPFSIPGLDEPVDVSLTGFDLLKEPLLNKGTAFTEEERHAFRLHGLVPPHVGTLEEQVRRRLSAMRSLQSDFERYAFLRDLQELNETLFYALLVRHIEELLPLVYTPTVGEGCQRFSEIWRKPRGVFLSYPNRDRMTEILSNPRFDRVRVIVVSDGERILGLGDQGAGGMGIPIGKLALYSACAGIHPATTLPVLLDLGTNNPERLADPLYIGWQHERVRGSEYDAFVEAFIGAVLERWPNVLLQWEDFAGQNAYRLLERYQDRLCCFNDDIQGTAAVAAGTLMAAINVTGVPLTEQRIALLGAGSAGCGVAGLMLGALIEAGLSPRQARERFFAVDRDGLLLQDTPQLSPRQQQFARPRDSVAGWRLETPERISLLDVVTNAHPTVLIGVCAQPQAFTEAVVREMARHVDRPVIFPLSNPTVRCEATPEQLMEWTQGRAIIGTGSPFPPVMVNGRSTPIDQTNNSYIFPGIGLGVIASDARRVNDAMFMAAAKALAYLSPTVRDKQGRLLPPPDELRSVSVSVAMAVARQAQADALAPPCDEASLMRRIRANVWEPRYWRYQRRQG